jgi:hypothetical protein
MTTYQTTFSIHIAQLLQDCDRQFEAVGFNCPLIPALRR